MRKPEDRDGYKIRIHPDGGYVALYYTGVDRVDVEIPTDAVRHEKLAQALAATQGEWTTYGTTIHPEVFTAAKNFDASAVEDGGAE